MEVRHQAEIPWRSTRRSGSPRPGSPAPWRSSSRSRSTPRPGTTTCPVPPPPPLPVRRGGVLARSLGLLADRRRRVGIYAGMGCIDAGPALARVAELLQAPVATSVSGKGCIPDAHPLAVGWGYGKQGTRAAEQVFRDVDLVLAVGVRYSEVSTANYAIPQHDTSSTSTPTRTTWAGTSTPASSSAPTRGSSSTACSPMPRPSGVQPAPRSGRGSATLASSTAARIPGSGSSAASTR